MTSPRPYWCSKTMKRRPCWCAKKIIWWLNSFLLQSWVVGSIDPQKGEGLESKEVPQGSGATPQTFLGTGGGVGQLLVPGHLKYRVKEGRTIFRKVSMPSGRGKTSCTGLLLLTSRKKICLEEVYIKHETQCFMRLSYDVENYTDLGCCYPVILLDQNNSSHHTQPHTIMNNE